VAAVTKTHTWKMRQRMSNSNKETAIRTNEVST
jgi:hypothetical protein